MALAKSYEDIVEARRENGAAIVYDYQHPQENARRVNVQRIVLATRPALRLVERIKIRVFSVKVLSDPHRVDPELLSQTADWSAAHFAELAKRSPEALARLAMAYRDHHRTKTNAILELLGSGN
jgi:hypothetical protein